MSSFKNSDLVSFDVTANSQNKAISSDSTVRKSVVLLADIENVDGGGNSLIVKVGQSLPTFPLSPGAAVELYSTQLNFIFIQAVSGSPVVHVITGGS